MFASYRLTILATALLSFPLLADQPTPTPASTEIPDLPPISDAKAPTPTASPTHPADASSLPPISDFPSPSPGPSPTPSAKPVVTSTPLTPTPTPTPAVTASPIPTPEPTPTPKILYFTTPSPTPEPEHLLNQKEEWTLETLKGKTFGFEKMVSGQKGSLFVTIRHEEHLIRRQGYSMRWIKDIHMEEDSSGNVVSFEYTGTNPDENEDVTGVRNGDKFVIHSPGQGNLTVPVPLGTSVGPYSADKQESALPLVAGQKLEIHLFSLDHYKSPDEVSYVVGAKTSHTLPDQTSQDLWPISVIHEGSTQPRSTLWMNDNHQILTEERTIPGLGDLVLTSSNKTECSKPLDGVELFASTLIRPDRSLTNQSVLGQASYTLSCPSLSTDLPIWKDDVYTQEVTKSKPGTADVTVWLGSFAPESASYELPMTSPPPELEQYLKPSRYLESDSPEIKSLAYQAAGTIKNPVIVARRIETFVRAYITKKDYRLGFLSARTTAYTCEGDCKEHSVLCAAMGRALGLPTRCVVGLCYVPPNEELYASVPGDVSHGIFGFHMWAEAYIAPNIWMPMDAATYGYDVGHIALFKTALDEDNPDFENGIGPVSHDLSIHITGTDMMNRPLPLPKPTEDPQAFAPKQLD